jgi:hypothetical protein
VNELPDRIVATAKCVTHDILANTCREIECRLDVCRAANGVRVELY